MMKIYIALIPKPQAHGIKAPIDFEQAYKNLKRNENTLLFADKESVEAFLNKKREEDKKEDEKNIADAMNNFIAYTLFVDADGEQFIQEKTSKAENSTTLTQFNSQHMFVGSLTYAVNKPASNVCSEYFEPAFPHGRASYCRFFNKNSNWFRVNYTKNEATDGVATFFTLKHQSNLKEDAVKCLQNMLKDYYSVSRIFKFHWNRSCVALAKAVEKDLSTKDQEHLLVYLQLLRSEIIAQGKILVRGDQPIDGYAENSSYLSPKNDVNLSDYIFPEENELQSLEATILVTLSPEVDKEIKKLTRVNTEGSFMRRLDFAISTLQAHYIHENKVILAPDRKF